MVFSEIITTIEPFKNLTDLSRQTLLQELVVEEEKG